MGVTLGVFPHVTQDVDVSIKGSKGVGAELFQCQTSCCQLFDPFFQLFDLVFLLRDPRALHCSMLVSRGAAIEVSRTGSANEADQR